MPEFVAAGKYIFKVDIDGTYLDCRYVSSRSFRSFFTVCSAFRLQDRRRHSTTSRVPFHLGNAPRNLRKNLPLHPTQIATLEIGASSRGSKGCLRAPAKSFHWTNLTNNPNRMTILALGSHPKPMKAGDLRAAPGDREGGGVPGSRYPPQHFAEIAVHISVCKAKLRQT